MLRARRLWALLAVLAILSAAFTACGPTPTPPPPTATPVVAKTATPVPPAPTATPLPKLKVAFVYVGPIGDGGWTYAHDQGRLALEKKLPYVETAKIESVPEGADAERVIRDFAQKGYNIIFATSFGYMDSVINVAKDFPKTYFLHCTGYKTAANVGIYDGRGYQGWYLAGIAAGKMTKKNVLGYVAPYPIPEVIRNLNAFTLGARSVNPRVKVHIVWINAWFDPPKEQAAATTLMDLGADVVARESDSTAPDSLALSKGFYVVGYNSDSSAIAKEAFVTAPIWDWGVYYTKAVEDIKNGTWKNVPYWGRMSDGIIKLAPFGSKVTDEAKKLVEAKQKEILENKWDVFTGPIKDQKGEVKVPAGKVMTDEEMLSFNWLVEGVVGSIPK